MVDVGSVAHGGHCVARHEGRVVFVRHALPGEWVRVLVTEGSADSRYLRADAVEVLVASPDRVPQPCPYARPGRCGGCDWQHATLDAQRRLKAAVVEEQLRRLAGLSRAVVVEPVTGDRDGLGWRTRMRFAVGAGDRLGLHAHRSSHVVPVDRCLIADPAVEELGVLRRTWPGAGHVEVLVAGSGERAVVVDPAPVAPAGLPAGIPALDAPAALLGADGRGGVERLRGRTWLREHAAGRDWRVTGSGFWQVHPGAAEVLVEAVLAGLDPRPGETALDLYAGVGLFAGPLAERVGRDGEVVAVEADARAVADARRNLHDLPRVRLVHGAVEQVLLGRPRTVAEPAAESVTGPAGRPGIEPAVDPTVDLAVLDPPRSGAGRAVVAALADRAPRRIAYVACDPAALARDLATFAGRGYALESLRAFDLFPMTSHVECVAVLAPTSARSELP